MTAPPRPRTRKTQSAAAAKAPAVVLLTPCADEGPIRAILATAAEAAGRAYLDDAALLRGEEASGALIVLSDARRMPPDTGPLVVIMPEPRRAAQAAALRHGVSGEEGFRFAAAQLAEASDLAWGRGALVVCLPDRQQPTGREMGDILAALGLKADPASALSATVMAPAADAFAEAASAALELYRRGPPDVGAGAAWTRQLLRSGEHPDQPCPEMFDVTGRARILAFGPIAALPAGCWKLTVRLEAVDAEAAAQSYLVEFGGGGVIAQANLRADRGAGVYDVVLEAEWPRAEVVELRIWLARAAFHGSLRFLGARCERVGGPSSRAAA